MKNNIIKELKNRNLINQISNEKQIIKELKKNNTYIYCGFDPTYESLHIGHLIPLITLKRFKTFGHKIIILIGNFTAMIGDPSFKKKKRKNNSIKNINKFSNKIKKQIKKIISNDIYILKNNKWFNKMKLNFFLKDLGKNFILNQMINKEFLKKRNFKNKNGINFSELSYTILQSYDFLYLFNNKKTKIQIGGSDQWGNIISGINLIKKKNKKESYGITLPLMVGKNGIKLSKTESNNIWLDEKKTTPYEFYQFWLNIPDEHTYIYLKQLTFLNIKKINYIIKNKNINKAKKILAENITKLIYGEKNTKNIIFATNIFFKKKIKIKKIDLEKLYKTKIPKINISNKIKNLKNILILLKITKTKSQSHNIIFNKSITINNKKIKNTNYEIEKKDKLFSKFTIIKKGKKNFYLIKWTN